MTLGQPVLQRKRYAQEIGSASFFEMRVSFLMLPSPVGKKTLGNVMTVSCNMLPANRELEHPW